MLDNHLKKYKKDYYQFLYFIVRVTILYGLKMSDSPDISESSSGVSRMNFQKDLRQRCHESLTCQENRDPGTRHWVEEKDNRSRKISSEGDVPLCYCYLILFIILMIEMQ